MTGWKKGTSNTFWQHYLTSRSKQWLSSTRCRSRQHTVFFSFSKKKKREGVHSEIWLWRDEASFCGEMIGSECWPETSIWRRDRAVADSSSFSIVQISSTIFSMNSDSRLQRQAQPQLVFLKNRVSAINWSYNKEEMSYEKWIEAVFVSCKWFSEKYLFSGNAIFRKGKYF